MTEFDIDNISLHKVLDFLPYPFLLSESSNGVQRNIFVNTRFLDEIGYTCEEIPSISDWFDHAYPDELYRKEIMSEWSYRTDIAREYGHDCVVVKAHIQTKHHGKKWYEVKASIYGPVHFVAFVNINVKIKREQRLAKLNESQNRTLSILSHDLRTPLVNLHSLIQMFIKDTITAEESKTMARKVDGQVFRLLEFFDTTLHWSRVNFKALNVQKKLVPAREIIDAFVALYADTYIDKNINIVVDVPISEVLVTDADIFAIVFRNVFSNAIKYTPPGGFIAVRNTFHNEKYSLIVENSGKTIDKEQIERIKAKNYSSKLGTQGERGLGIGLKLCQQVLELVGGTLEIYSPNDNRTAVMICFDGS